MPTRSHFYRLILIVLICVTAARAQTNYALRFDGDDDYIDLGNSSDLKFTAEMTVECWVYADDWAPGKTYKFISNSHSGGYSLALFSSNNIYFHVAIAGNYKDANVSSTTLESGWHHFAGSFDGRYIKLYIDGELVNTNDLGSSGHVVSYTYDNSTLLGKEASAGSAAESWGALDGMLDEVRFWDSALSQEQIRRCKDVEIPVDAGNLVAYYKLEPSTYYPSSITDYTSNNNHGTVHGNPQRLNSTAITIPTPNSDYSGSTYYISDKEDLTWLSRCVPAWNRDFIQNADIVFDAADFQTDGLLYHEGRGWLPIGYDSYHFTGTYEGGNHEISGLVVNHSANNAGLFGWVSNAGIEDLGLIDPDITSTSSYAGTLVGFAENTTIDRCYSSGLDAAVETSGNLSGGLIGGVKSSIVRNCYTTAAVTGASSAAGFCGENEQSTIENCYAAGPVTSGAAIDCGFTANNISPSIYRNNFFDKQTTGQSNGIGASGITSEEMRNIDIFSDTSTAGLTTAWDFIYNINDDNENNAIWDMDQLQTVNNGYPILSWQEGADNTLFDYDFEGSGTTVDPFLISTLEDLRIMSENIFYWRNEFHFRQTANIDASETTSWNGGEGFIPIGSTEYPFTGEYDGNKHIIDGLTINRPSESNVGFFGYVSGPGTIVSRFIQYLWLKDVDITGDIRVGGMVGYFHPGKAATINNSVVTGDIKASDEAGAFAGSFMLDYVPGSFSLIDDCYAIGSVTRYSGSTGTDFGGFCGNTDARIINSYSAVSVNEADGVAWSTGDKGFIGNDISGYYANLFFDKTVSGQNSDAAAVGKTTSEMQSKSMYSGYTFIGENSTVEDYHWGMNPNENGAYPFMNWQPFLDENSYSFTGEASEVKYYTAELNTEVVYVGASPVTAHGFCYSTDSDPTLDDTVVDFGSLTEAGNINHEITGLTPATQYYFRSYITSEQGTNYSNWLRNFTTKESPQFITGSGTENDPFEISTADDIQALSSNSIHWDDHFILTNDINASSVDFNPIGNSSTSFSGTFDGQGYEISGLSFSGSSSTYIAFFGATYQAAIKNLGIKDFSFTAQSVVGGLIAQNSISTVTNCYAAGQIDAAGDWLGGLIARNSSSTVINCYSDVSISSRVLVQEGHFEGFEWVTEWNPYYYGYIGGLIGKNEHSNIINCYSEGDLSAGAYGGGLVGYNYNSDISNSYSRSVVYFGELHSESTSGSSGHGSFAGYVKESKIENCFATIETDAGVGFVGFEGTNPNNDFQNNFIETTGSAYIGATAKTTVEIKNLSTFTSLATVGLDSAWDFRGVANDDSSAGGIWDMEAGVNDGYPYLIWQHTVADYPGPENNNSLSLYVPGATSEAAVNFQNQMPQASSLPTGIHRTFPFYWQINAPSGTFPHAIISMPVTGLSGIADTNALVWLKRADSSEPWTNIGGTYADGVLTSDPFNTFSEFTIGSSDEDSSLPVTLLAFSGKSTKSGVVLEWETGAEIENAGFILRRRPKATEQGIRRQADRLQDKEEELSEIIASYQDNAELQGQGTTTEVHTYSYEDKSVEPGISYIYTLSDVDLSANETELQQLEVQVEAGTAIIADSYTLRSAYPNPFNASFTLPFTLNEQMVIKVLLYNINGQKVMSIIDTQLPAGDYNYRVNADELSSGMYILRTTLDKNIHNQKILLLK